MRRILPLFLIVLAPLAACSTDEDFTPTEPGGPSIPTLGGTYSSDGMWRFDLSTAAGQNVFNCGGGVTITNQVGTSFSGIFFLRDPACAGVGGNLENGVYQTDGAVTFNLTVTIGGTSSNFITAAFGCTYVSGDQGLTGTLRNNQLEATSSTVMDCGSDGIVTLVMRLSGTR